MTTEPAEASRAKDYWTLGLCAALLLLFAILSYSASLTENATYDEPLHATGGAFIRQDGDYRIDPEDPAFFLWLSSLPHSSEALKIDRYDPNLTGKTIVNGIPATQPSVTEDHDRQWTISVKTLYRTPGNDPDAYFNQSRFLFMLFGLACGGLVCWWAWKLAGRVGAFAATLCYALDPNFIGHSSLVKNDVPLALVTVGLMFALWRAGRRVTWWNLAAICLALAAAMNVKFSGPIFFVIALIALLVRAMMSEGWPILGMMELKDRLSRLVVPFAVCFVAAIVSWIAIWACYGFRYTPTKDPSVHFDLEAIVQRYKSNLWQIENQKRDLTKVTNDIFKEEVSKIPRPAMADIIAGMEKHRLLPETWLHGFFFTYATTRMRGSFLDGQRSIQGWWYFFPACVLYKTPTAVLVVGLLALIAPLLITLKRGFSPWDILSALAFVLAITRITMWILGSQKTMDFNADFDAVIFALVVIRLIPLLITRVPQAEWWDATCLVLPVLVYGGMAMVSNFNLGIRHVLPLLPFLHIAVGIIVSRLLWRWGKAGALVAGGLAMALAVETCSTWPNFISFFNAPSGGWRGGISKLSDSNLDWGQDLRLVADWQAAHPEKLMYMCYFGMADPEYYHIQRIELPGGYPFASHVGMPGTEGVIVISATNLQGTYMNAQLRQLYAPLQKLEPREILGGTIYIFDWPLKPPTTQQ